MSDPVLDVRSARALLRRRSRLLAAAAVLGLAAGAAYVALVPPTLTSTALVLLPTPTATDGGGERDVDTQVRIALSTSVLGRAGESLRPALTAREVEDRVRVEAPTNQLVEIRASSERASEARTLAQAVADTYVTFVREADRRVAAAALSDLSLRERDLSTQVDTLQDEIDAAVTRQRSVPAGSADARVESQLLARLRAEQADVSLQLDKVKGDIAVSAPTGTSAGAGTSVLQDASPAVGPHLGRRLVSWLPLASLAAVALVAAGLLLSARREPRMGFRDEIADAVGSPVLGATRSHPQRSVAGWRVLLGTYDATAVESWAFRQVLRGLAAAEDRDRTDARGRADGRGRVEHPRSVTVVTLAGDGSALALGPQLAAFAASLGISTRLVAGRGHDRSAALWAALTTQQAAHPRGHLTIGPEDPEEPDELTVVLAVADRSQPDLSGTQDTSTLVIAVAALAATEQELARVAVAVDDLGRRIDGVLVADPDRTDRTTGRHTLDERASRVPLPVRLTGVGSVGGPTGDPRRRR